MGRVFCSVGGGLGDGGKAALESNVVVHSHGHISNSPDRLAEDLLDLLSGTESCIPEAPASPSTPILSLLMLLLATHSAEASG